MASVTVLMPTHERDVLLREALESALAQTYEDFVILVGDNSKTDTTEAVVASYDDERIRYHRNRPSLGPQGNWVDLVRRAETPLVASLHDDDRWHPDFLATVVPPMLDDPSVAMTFTDFWMIDSNGDRLVEHTEQEAARTHRSSIPSGRVDYDLAEGLRLVAVWNAPQPAYAAVLRREVVAAVDFPEAVSPLYDIWLSYRIVKQGLGLRYEPTRLTEYRIHPGAVTSGGFARAEDEVFRRVVTENRDVGEIVAEVANYWATLRWSRGTRLMTSTPADRQQSQRELLAAAPSLHGQKKYLAMAGGHCGAAWHGMRLGRTFLHRRAGAGEPRYAGSSQLSPAE